jgi:hypothetical protein
MTGFLCCPQHLIDEELKHVTIATLCPSPCKVDITPAFSCGVSEDCVFSFLIPTVLPMLATASSLSPDSRSVVMPSCCNLILTKENKVFFVLESGIDIPALHQKDAYSFQNYKVKESSIPDSTQA